MITDNHIMYTQRYWRFLSKVLQEYRSKEDYLNDTNNFFDNLVVSFWTKSLPDTEFRDIKIGNKYYMTMTITQLRKYCALGYDASEFCNEIIYGVIKHLPSNFFEGANCPVIQKRVLKSLDPAYYPDDLNDMSIVEDLELIDNFIGKNINKFWSYELRKLIYITMKFNGTRDEIDRLVNGSDNRTASIFLAKDVNNKPIHRSINTPTIHDIKQEAIQSSDRLFSMTGDKSFLMNDVMYKCFITRSIKEWIDLYENVDIVKSSDFFTVLKEYPNIRQILENNISSSKKLRGGR